MQIVWIDPFHGGSHAAVSEGFARRSRHDVALLTLPIDGGWRWRMRGGAVSLARLWREQALQTDLIVTTDMLDLATFRALSGSSDIPVAVYVHENQLTYPLPSGRSRDLSFAWINYTSALCADRLFFNSDFHRRSFLEALPGLLGRYHDYRELQTIDAIAAKAQVLTPGIDLLRLDQSIQTPERECADRPIILWNSRWEYDKQPEAFFDALEGLAARGIDFGLIVAGEHIDPNAPAFVAARERWADHIVHWGYAPDTASYSRLLHQADIVVSTALQEFFGIGIIEAIYCGCVPVLPRRLTYPDLLPTDLHADCLYRNQHDLVERLCDVIARLDALKQRPWQSIAAPYDWSHSAPLYDAAFEQLLRGR